MKHSFWGLVIIVIGITLLLSNLGFLAIDIGLMINTYWPGVLIFIGVYHLLSALFVPDEKLTLNRAFSSIIMISIGFVILGNKLNWFQFTVSLWSLFWPLLIIYVGISLISSSSSFNIIFHTSKKKVISKIDPLTNETFEQYTGASQQDHTANSNILIGSYYIGKEPWVLEDRDINVKIGETIIDLSKAFIKDGETVINVEGVVGDVTIIVPEGLSVDVKTHIKLGNTRIFKSNYSGTPGTNFYQSEDYQVAVKKVKICVHLKAGDIDIKRVD